jgi:hypothetical protein
MKRDDSVAGPEILEIKDKSLPVPYCGKNNELLLGLFYSSYGLELELS